LPGWLVVRGVSGELSVDHVGQAPAQASRGFHGGLPAGTGECWHVSVKVR